MKNYFVKRGWIALVVICSVAALQATASAQTNLYWQGGPGTWAMTGTTTQWYPGVTNWTPSGSATTWDNTPADNVTAGIGYLTKAGSGGYYGTTAITQTGKPTVINLDPVNPVNVSQVTFAANGSSSTSGANSAYLLTGGTLNLTAAGASTIALDLSGSANMPGGFRATINSNIVAQSGTLNFNVLQYSGTATAGGILDLGGSNTFSTLNVGGIPQTSAIASAYWSGVVITDPHAINGANLLQVPNVNLGNNGELASLCANGQNINVNNIAIAGGAPSYLHNSTYGMYSTTGIGRIGPGAYVDLPHSSPYITVQGAISGPGDLVFGSGAGNDGRGVIILNGQSTYQGDTFMQQSSDRFPGDPAGMAIVRIGTTNALPVTTSIIFGRYNSTGNSGALDLYGNSQTVRSIGTMLSSAGATTNDYCGGITNFNPATGGTLTLLNDLSATAPPYGSTNLIESQFHGVIGKTLIDTTTRPTDSAASNNNITLVLGSSGGGGGGNGLSLTLGLAGSNAAPPAYPYGQSNTYSGGTVINGGALFAATGRVFSTTGTNANSATGTGPVTVNNGGILGGSIAGGAIGMPGTGPVTINAGGSLLPGGGWYVSSQGLGTGGYSTGAGTDAVFHPTANLPLNVLGNLTLNNDANVNFNYDGTHSDLVVVGGTLAAAGSVAINGPGSGSSMPSGTPIFEAGAPVVGFAALAPVAASWPVGTTLVNPAASPKIVYADIPGAAQVKVWDGNNSNVWNNLGAANFRYEGAANQTYNNANGDTAWFDDTAISAGTVNITDATVSPARTVFYNANNPYTIIGGGIANGAVLVAGGNTVTFSNSNTYSGGTTIQNRSTLVANNPAALPTGGAVTIQDASMLSLNFSGTYAGTISFLGGGLGTGATPTINVPGGQTAVFNGSMTTDGLTGAGMTMTGAGTLILANSAVTAVGGSNFGMTNINGGTVRIESVGTITSGTTSTTVSQLGQGPLTIGRTGNGGSLWVDNVTLGAVANTTPSVGFVDVYDKGLLGGTGSATIAQQAIALVLNTVDPSRPAGNFTLSTGSNRSDTLALQASFQQYDNNSANNNSWNFQLDSGTATTGHYTPLMTAHVAGSGTVKLQTGEVNYASTFGGVWSVDSGVLQVGPFVQNTNAGTGGVQWKGPNGEALNALGFANPIGQDIRAATSSTANPDLPNPVTVNNGGLLAVAVDQLNANPAGSSRASSAANATPPYLRNAITLNNGGGVAATGFEVTFNKSGGTANQAIAQAGNNPVTARLGGDFTVASGGTASILTYDPNGPARDYTGALIPSDTASWARTVELVGGSGTLANASPGLNAGTVINRATNWDGTLVVAASGTVGGTFNIKRSGGSVSVAPGAAIVVQPYATVNISNDNSSLLVSSTAADATYGFMVAPSAGPTSLPVKNNVLYDGTNAVAIINSGTFNVNAGTQTLGAITSDAPGVFNVTGTATAIAPSISQGTATVGPAATLTLTGPIGAVASNLVLANSGNLNVSGGSHTVMTVGTPGSIMGATSVNGAGTMLSASQLYQNSVTASNGGAIVLTAGGNAPLGTANSLTAASGKIDLGQSGFFLPTSGSAGLYSMIQAGYNPGKPAWSGSTGITSSLAASNPSSYAVGYGTASVGNTTEIILATTLPGDGGMTGTVDNSDMALVFGSSSNYALQPANPTWSQGNFVYQSTIGNADRQAVKQHLGQTLTFPPSGGGSKAAAPAGSVSPATSGPAEEVDYNSSTGSLSLVVSRTSDLDAFTVFLQNPPSTAQSLPLLWETVVASDSLQWGKQNNGDPTETLQPGTYPLADLGPGLTASAFGNADNGTTNNTVSSTYGAVTFYDSNYNQTNVTVAIVPEPGTLALLAAGAGAGIAVFWRRRRRAGSRAA